MESKKRLIDAIELANFFGFMRKMWIGSEIMNVIHEAETVNAVELKCKVGDWVYALWEAPVKQKYIIYCAEVKEIRIGMRNCRLTTTYRLEPIMYRGHIREYRDEDFGKLVFSSEEEAQEALSKMDGVQE